MDKLEVVRIRVGVFANNQLGSLLQITNRSALKIENDYINIRHGTTSHRIHLPSPFLTCSLTVNSVDSLLSITNYNFLITCSSILNELLVYTTAIGHFITA